MGSDTSLLAERVVQKIKQDIMSGALPAGGRLPSERDLAARFEVSRITIRTAISQLANLGFVQTLPQSGTFIRDFWNDGTLDLLIDVVSSRGPVDRDILMSLLDLRRIVEVYAVTRAVPVMDNEDIITITHTVHAMEGARDSIGTLIELDYELHSHYIRKAGNRVTQLIFNSCKPVYMFYLDFFYHIPGSTESIFPHYKKLLEATEAKDGSYASYIMEQLLIAAENIVKANLGPGNSFIITTALSDSSHT